MDEGRLDREALARLAVGVLTVDPVERAVLVHDLDSVDARLTRLATAAPGADIAVAVKANPLVGLLRHCVDRGTGLECASHEEVALARAAGCSAGRIVVDGPAKTHAELVDALAAGHVVHADRFGELEAMSKLDTSRALVGLRIDPGVAPGAIPDTTTTGPSSQFGIDLSRHRASVIEAYRRHAFLKSLHVHVGSQGMPMRSLLDAAEAAVALGDAIERAGGRLSSLDLGGGFPVVYRPGDAPFALDAWSDAIRCLGIDARGWALRLEPGRWIHAGAGFALSRVAGIKEVGGEPAVILHVGADLLPRRALRPDLWFHEIVVLDEQGALKEGSLRPTTVVGPLCFSGDRLGVSMPLPRVEEGDLVVVRDVGAYAMGLWSRHCSRGMPPVWGHQGGRWNLLRRGERPEDIVAFWS